VSLRQPLRSALVAGLAAFALAAGATGIGSGTLARQAAAAETAALPVFESADLTPVWRSPRELERAAREFPSFRFEDQSGRALTQGDLAGRIVVANFFFTGCSTLCPRLRSSMARVHREFAGQGVLLLSHSVTPEADTAPMLAAYARANGIDGEQWRLLTGPREVLHRVMREGYLVPAQRGVATEVLHTELFVLLDGRQRVRGIYNGTLAVDIDHLVDDIRTLQAAGSAQL
jgi:protein SCO1